MITTTDVTMDQMAAEDFFEENAALILLIFGIAVVLLLLLVAYLCFKLHWRKCRSSSPVLGEHPTDVGADIAYDNQGWGDHGIFYNDCGEEYCAPESYLELRRYRKSSGTVHGVRTSGNMLKDHSQRALYTDSYDSEEGRGGADGNDPGESGGEIYCNVLMDSALRELMEPDMRESIVCEVRSKFIVFISRKIDHMGGSLVLDKMGISLFIPPCAVEPGKSETIFLALNWDLKDLPSMTPTQTVVSPVVHVGPHGLELKRRATLSFRHCAFDVNEVKVYSSETHLMQNKTWSVVEENGEGNQQKTHQILETECQVYISHFTLYTCIAEGGSSTKKWLQLLAFGKRVGGQYEVRVYLLNNTPCALQFAVENEKKFRFKQIKCPQDYLFVGDGTSMLLEVESINEGWSSNLSDLKEEIPFFSIWHGKCPYATFVFKRESERTRELNVTIGARQGAEHKLRLKLLKKMRWSESRRSRNLVQKTDSDPSLSESSTVSTDSSLGAPPELISEDYFPRSGNGPHTVINVQHGEDSGHASLCDQPCCASVDSQVIPHKLKMKLAQLLDPQCTVSGNDWRMIASELGLDPKIPLMSVRSSPFLEVLKIMQERKMDLEWLEMTLIKHERIDAANIITHYLKTRKIEE